MPFHLLIYISAHGFGHLAMTAPVINRLAEKYQIKITIRTQLPKALVDELITAEVTLLDEASDFGMMMKSALEVDLSASQKQYSDLHAHWDESVSREAQAIKLLQPDLVLSNVPYLPLAAASKLGIPSIAYCSLNWADIYESYFGSENPESQKIVMEIRNAYQAAECFVCPEPSMPVAWTHNKRTIGPVAQLGKNRKAAICQHLALPEHIRLVLITPGGIDTRFEISNWSKRGDVHWLISGDVEGRRNDFTHVTDLPFSFNQILCSCDAVICKPGYGTVADTVCNNIPVLYVPRGDWAEEKFLVQWWQQYGRVAAITRQQFFDGNVLNDLDKLWHQAMPEKILPAGLDELVSIISEYIQR